MSAVRSETREAMQASRGVAILIVVLFHADVTLSYYFQYMPFETVKAVLRFLPMPIFFLSVGMSFAPTCDRPATAPGHMARRAVHYGYLFVLWTLIDRFVVLILTAGHELSVRAWVNALVHPPGVLWFLDALTAQLVIFACIVRLPKALQFSIGVALLLVSAFLHGRVTLGITQNLIFVLLGAWFSAAIHRVIATHALRTLAWCLPSYAILAAAIWAAGYSYLPVIEEVTSLVGILGLVAFWKLVAGSGAARLTGELGRLSFQIYVIHIYFVQLFAMLVLWAGLDIRHNVQLQYLAPLCSVVVSIMASLLLGATIRNAKWLFTKPSLVARYIDPIMIWLVESVASIAGIWATGNLRPRTAAHTDP